MIEGTCPSFAKYASQPTPQPTKEKIIALSVSMPNGSRCDPGSTISVALVSLILAEACNQSANCASSDTAAVKFS